MNDATPTPTAPAALPKPPQFVPPRYDDFATTNEDKTALLTLKEADRRLAHAEQEMRGARDQHRHAMDRHTEAATAFAGTPGGKAYHDACATAWAKHGEAMNAHHEEVKKLTPPAGPAKA